MVVNSPHFGGIAMLVIGYVAMLFVVLCWIFGLGPFEQKKEEIKKIIVAKRSDDFHACLEGHPEIWGCGKDSCSAIGDLTSTHKDCFKIEVEYRC